MKRRLMCAHSGLCSKTRRCGIPLTLRPVSLLSTLHLVLASQLFALHLLRCAKVISNAHSESLEGLQVDYLTLGSEIPWASEGLMAIGSRLINGKAKTFCLLQAA